jgi:hypothetical protein
MVAIFLEKRQLSAKALSPHICLKADVPLLTVPVLQNKSLWWQLQNLQKNLSCWQK